jgi:hypothetical protein
LGFQFQRGNHIGNKPRAQRDQRVGAFGVGLAYRRSTIAPLNLRPVGVNSLDP